MFGSRSILTPADFLGEKLDTLGAVELSAVQVNPVEPVFASLDAQAPLNDADYLDVTGSLASRINITAAEFWRRAGVAGPQGDDEGDRSRGAHPPQSRGRPAPPFLYYELPVHLNFKGVASHLPPGVPMERKGPLTPRFVFAPAQTWKHPFQFFVNTFLTVLSGEVDVVLFAPNQTLSLYPYPRNHPNGRSGQVLYHNGLVSPRQVLDIATRFRNIPRAEGSRTTLRPGDSLYVPPFWFYQLHFPAPTILLKTFSSIYEGEVLDDLLRLDIPHIDHIDTEVAAIKRAIDLLVRDSLGQDPSVFITRLLESRYVPLYRHLSLVTSTDFAPCHGGVDEQTARFTTEFLLPYVTQVVTTLRALDDFGFVKELVAQEFVEHLTHKALGAEDAYNFYANCFDTGVTNSRSTAQDVE